jgi:hypothetical protein
MTVSLAVPARSTGRTLPLVAFVALVAGLALAGTLIAILTLTAGHEDGGLPGTSVVGHPITTSYGTMTVESAETIGGLTSQDLGGVTHGIQNLVLSDKAQVEVAVLFANAGDAPVRVDPSQFRLVVEGTADPVEPTGSTIRSLQLAPGARLEASLTFVVPQSGARMTVDYVDPGNAAAITVPIGILGQAPASPDNGHAH